MVSFKTFGDIEFYKDRNSKEHEIWLKKDNLTEELVPTKLHLTHSCGNYVYELTDAIVFSVGKGLTTMALDYKAIEFPLEHIKDVLPSNKQDEHIDRSMLLTVFITYKQIPHKGNNVGRPADVYTSYSEIYTGNNRKPSQKVFHVYKTHCIRLNRLGTYTNPTFCKPFLEFEDDLTEVSTNTLVTDLIRDYPYQRGRTNEFVNQFLKTGITYDKGIYIVKEPNTKAIATVSLDTPRVNTNIHLLNNFSSKEYEPEFLFPIYGRREEFPKWYDIDEIYRYDVTVKS